MAHLRHPSPAPLNLRPPPRIGLAHLARVGLRGLANASGLIVVAGAIGIAVGIGLVGAGILIGAVIGWDHAAWFGAGGTVQIVAARITGWNRTRHLRELLDWLDANDTAGRFLDLRAEQRAKRGLP